MFHTPSFEDLALELAHRRLVIEGPIGTLPAQALVAKSLARPRAAMEQLGVQAQPEMTAAAHGEMLRAFKQPFWGREGEGGTIQGRESQPLDGRRPRRAQRREEEG